MKRYVAGLLFDDVGSSVILMTKTKPVWQMGRINAIGGKIEKGESPLMAMDRESLEEINVCPVWDEFMTLEGRDFEVVFFRAFDTVKYETAEQMEDEPLVLASTDYLPWGCVPNIHWIVPMALSLVRYDEHEIYRVRRVPF